MEGRNQYMTFLTIKKEHYNSDFYIQEKYTSQVKAKQAYLQIIQR